MTEQNEIKVQGELANKTDNGAVSEKNPKEKVLMVTI